MPSTRARRWKCSACGQAFTKKEHVFRHEKTHTNEKPFACSRCPKAYSRNDSLVRHMKKHTVRIENLFTATESASHGLNPEDHGQTFELRPEALPDADGGGFITNTDITIEGQSGQSQRVASGQSLLDGSFSPHALASGIDDWFWLPSADFSFELPPLATFQTTSRTADLGINSHEVQPTWNTCSNKTTGSYSLRRAVHDRWVTRPPVESTSTDLSGANRDHNSTLVDESYRIELSNCLGLASSEENLPSVDFLNLAIKMYSSNLHPVFPVIHAATLRLVSSNSLLILSMCSIGALFIGSDSARAQGRFIFRRLCTVITSSWEFYLCRGVHESWTVAQAIVLFQNFGMLSGDSSDLLLNGSLHGAIISLVRQRGVFDLRNTLNAIDLGHNSDIESAWANWIQAEEEARIVLALHLQDSQFSAIFRHEPILRHHPENLPVCCSEPVFGAKTANQWHDLVEASRSQTGQEQQRRAARPYTSSPTNAYTSLAGIHASITEARLRLLTEEAVADLRHSLISWRRTWFPNGFEAEGVSGWATIQWHHNFMCLYADMDLIEKAIGRDGQSDEAEQAARDVTEWTMSVEGKHSLAHAVLIVKRLEKMPLCSEPGIHIPLSAFHAGLVLYSHIRWAGVGTNKIFSDVPELSQDNFKSLPRVIEGGSCKDGEVDMSLLSRLVDLLRRQGHWGISRSFAAILEILVDETAV